jgi:general stress protein 26
MSKSTNEIALQILNENHVGIMATNNAGKPNSRYMTFLYFENKLYTAAEQNSTVVKEIKENSSTHILLGYENEGLLETFLEIEGDAQTTLHDVVKQELLKIYPVANQQDFEVIQVTPTRMRIMNKNGKNQQEVHFV